jgi:hypothetical protein
MEMISINLINIEAHGLVRGIGILPMGHGLEAHATFAYPAAATLFMR